MERAQIEALQGLAARQHGLFTCAQADDLLVSPSALRQAADRGWIRSVRRGVYAFCGRPPSRWEAILASALSAGPSAVISHAAAVLVHGFWGIAHAAPELTFRASSGRRLEGVRIHRSVTVRPEDVVLRCGVPVTSPVRTLIDLAPRMNDHLLPRIIDDGAIARLWTPEEIAARLSRGPRAPEMTDRLRALVALRTGEGHPDSVLEQRIFRVLKARVPPFEIHHRLQLAGRVVELDMAWPCHRIAGEVEGRQVRLASQTKFDSDRVRSNLLERSGWPA